MRPRSRTSELDVELTVSSESAGRAARARARRPGRARGGVRRERAVAPARLGGRAHARAEAPLRPLGRLRARRRPPPRPRPASACRSGSPASTGQQRAARLPAARDAAPDRQAASTTQLYTGNEVARQKGEGMEFADLRAVRPRRPRPLDQLARERPPRRARRQRAASGAERRRRSSSSTRSPTRARADARRSTSRCARPRRWLRATSSGATASGSSRSAASSAG